MWYSDMCRAAPQVLCASALVPPLPSSLVNVETCSQSQSISGRVHLSLSLSGLPWYREAGYQLALLTQRGREGVYF